MAVKVKLIPSHYTGDGKEGDFTWMIERPEYADALFIFNDNEEQFRDFVKDPRHAAPRSTLAPDTPGCRDGIGNAKIRHYRCVDPPRAAGIPTGDGYLKLTEAVRSVIDEAVDVVKEMLFTRRYRRVFYSAGKTDDELGTETFDVGDDVKRYIVAELRKLEAFVNGRD
jgi:hypothetical protein